MTNKLPEVLRLAKWLDRYPRRCLEFGEAAAMLRTQHALLERAWNNLDAATSYSRKSARDSHSKLLADIAAYLEMK